MLHQMWNPRRDVYGTLAAYGYQPRTRGDGPRWPLYFTQAHRMVVPPVCAPTRAVSGASRSGSFRSGGRWRSAAYARLSGAIVIRDDARGSSPAPVVVKREVKKDTHVSLPCGQLELPRPKDEDMQPPPLPKKWWEMELEAHAAYHGPDDPADTQDNTCSRAAPSTRTTDRSRTVCGRRNCGPPGTPATSLTLPPPSLLHRLRRKRRRTTGTSTSMTTTAAATVQKAATTGP
jgi:hypothetical protein